MDPIFTDLIVNFGLPSGMVGLLFLGVFKGWLVPMKFYNEVKETSERWEEVACEQKEINRNLTDAVKDLSDGLSGSNHLLRGLNEEFREAKKGESDQDVPK